MYEEESHYYIDVLCDDFCEIVGKDNQIVLVEDDNLGTIDSQPSEIVSKRGSITTDERYNSGSGTSDMMNNEATFG